MPSFDVISEVDLQEVDNAVNQTSKEISQRFDFKGSKSTVEWDKNTKKIKIVADDDFKLRSITQVLEGKFAKRNIDLQCLKYGKTETGSMGILRQEIELKSGMDKEETKKVTKFIKELKLKVSTEIQDDKVRVTAKKIDDLQDVQQKLRNGDLKMPLQFTNQRS